MTHPSAPHPPRLIESVVKGVPSEWRRPLRVTMEAAQMWWNWVVLYNHGTTIEAQWFGTEPDMRRWLEKPENGRPDVPTIHFDIGTRLRRQVNEDVEATLAAVDWDAEID